jgi:nitroreductase
MTAAPGALGLSLKEALSVLAAMSLAPSVHNSQPWRLRLLPDRIELHADLDRALPATDPESRELRLSCGAALYNLRLALSGLGIRPLVTLLPGAAAPGALATIRRGGRLELTEETRALLQAVPVRRTNRRPFFDGPVPAAHAQAMVRAAELERSWLHVVSDNVKRARLQDFVVRAERLQKADPAVQAELDKWDAAEHGVPTASAEPHAEGVPLIVVLCSYYDGPLAELQSGQAMQRVLLAATTLGLSASFMSQPVEVRAIREELRHMLGGSLEPQALLHIGFGPANPATPRRPVSELLIEPTDIPT